MISTEQMVLALGILFLASFVRSSLGFGDALLAMPLLTLVIGIQAATPLVALAAPTNAIIILLGDWRNVEVKASWRLVLSSVVGIPLGLLLLKSVPESIVKGVLGALLIGFGVYQMVRPQLPSLRRQGWAYLFGFIAGVLGGAYNTNGPPVIVYGTLRRWSPERFRATLQSYFFPTGLAILLSHGLTGFWTPIVLRLYGFALPLIFLAIILGGRLNRVLSGGQFNRIVYAGLILLGVFLFL